MRYAMNTLYCEDCLPAMREMPDQYFELAIVDPPYGGGVPRRNVFDHAEKRYLRQVQSHGWNVGSEIFAGGGGSWTKKERSRFGGIFDRYEIPANETTGDISHWDVAPEPEYFEELFRVSKNQVIWGGNYFDLPPTRGFLVWYKYVPASFSMAMCEYAWTSFNANAKLYMCAPQGTQKEPRFHPTQKPVALYRWCLTLCANPGDKILDTHVGSASSIIACIEHGYDWMGFEIDPGYHAKAQQRIDQTLAQGRLEL